MTIWQGALIIVATLSAFPSLYGLVRLIRWLKQRGWLSLRNERTGSSAMSCFVAMQQFVEPAVKHIHELNQRRDTGRMNTPTDEGSNAASLPATRSGCVSLRMRRLTLSPQSGSMKRNGGWIRKCVKHAAPLLQ